MVYFDIVGDDLTNCYHDGNFYRSEVVVKTIKDEFQLPNSDDVIAVSSGFPVGLGGAGCSYGAVVEKYIYIACIWWCVRKRC